MNGPAAACVSMDVKPAYAPRRCSPEDASHSAPAASPAPGAPDPPPGAADSRRSLEAAREKLGGTIEKSAAYAPSSSPSD
ncbi:hypothetical protein SPAR_34891 [Streptomyces sparsogenes DSM 40356]|uniref:Uncharacterized protein n=2 Tax=Streptomyces sparsogenes TaxID=67365 RepID=A0A1R1S933_9ACTN|nr:hypothetical protein [Streptomyces sparsogenes]OMI34720.1 hypothetical protein SPAR_34891 [Streptomyces sparsogenes DSM 40356]